MDPKSELRQRAREYAQQLAARDAQLQKELTELKRHVVLKQAEIDRGSKAMQRFQAFDPSLAGELQCPYCWMFNHVRSDLKPVAGGDRHHDIYRCGSCRSEFEIAF